MKFTCGITVFNPEDTDISYINELSGVFDYIVVFDNTEGSLSNLNKDLLDKSNITVISNGNNDGLSVAFNTIFTYYSDNKQCTADYVCLLDQDSRMSKSSIQELMEIIEGQTVGNTAVYAPRIDYDNEEKEAIKEGLTSVDWVISSGSFIRLDLLKTIGYFDENYFIDRIDFDFCFKVCLHGFKIKVIESVKLKQQLGHSRKLFGIKFFEHSPLRNYYMARNRIYFYQKYQNHFNFVYFKVVIVSIKHILKVLLLDSSKFKKLQFISRGFTDAFKKRMGKFEI
jgi:rhamnosyltransferase